MTTPMTTVMDKERLAAFVDGELAPEEAAAVVLHLARHPGDQAYVDELYAANAALAQAFAGPLHEPVPEAIRAAILGAAPAAGSNVVAFRPRPKLPLVFGGLALAASVALAVVALPQLWRAPAAGVALGAMAAADPLAAVLAQSPSGVPAPLADGREAMVLASYALPDGRLCREVELVDAGAGRVDYAIGCRTGAGWTVEAAIAEMTGAGPDAVVPAGDVETEALTRFLERQGRPQPLDAGAEAAAIARGWTAP